MATSRGEILGQGFAPNRIVCREGPECGCHRENRAGLKN
jgi:hypothetical protein